MVLARFCVWRHFPTIRSAAKNATRGETCLPTVRSCNTEEDHGLKIPLPTTIENSAPKMLMMLDGSTISSFVEAKRRSTVLRRQSASSREDIH